MARSETLVLALALALFALCGLVPVAQMFLELDGDGPRGSAAPGAGAAAAAPGAYRRTWEALTAPAATSTAAQPAVDAAWRQAVLYTLAGLALLAAPWWWRGRPGAGAARVVGAHLLAWGLVFAPPWGADGAPHARRLLTDTLRLALAVTWAATVLGVCYAWLAVKVRHRLSGLLEVAMMGPFLIPTYISAVTWMWTFQADGALNQWVAKGESWPAAALRDGAGFDGGAGTRLMPFEFAGFGWAGFVMVLAYSPVVAWLAAAALRRQDADREEAAVLALGPLRACWHVTLREALPAIGTGSVFVFLFACSNYAVPNLLRVQTFTSAVFDAYNRADTAAAAAAGLPLVALTGAALAVFWVLDRRGARSAGRSLRRARRTPWRARHTLLALPAAALLVLGLVHPLLRLLDAWSSRPDVESDFFHSGSVWRDRLNVLMVNTRRGLDAETGAGPDLLRSLALAAVAATAVTALAALLAYFARRGRAGARLLEALVILPFAFPALTVGVALIRYFNPAPDGEGPLGWWRRVRVEALYGTAGILLVAALARFLPFAFKPLAAAFGRRDPAEEEAARVAGRPWPVRMARIVFAGSAHAFGVAWVLVFVLTVMELDLLLMVRPAGFGTTLPERIFNAVHFGRYGIVAGWCCLLLAAIMLPPVAYRLLTGRRLELSA